MVVTPGEDFTDASAISGTAAHPPAGIVARAICPAALAAATCGTAFWRHLQLHHRVARLALPTAALTDSTTACPTGSAAPALPDPDDEPVVADAGVASTSTVCPADRSGGYWPGLTATPSRPAP